MTTPNNEYWAKRQNQSWANLEKDETKLFDKLDKYYMQQANELQKEIAAYFGQYGKDNVIEYRTLLTKLNHDDRRLLFERYDDFANKYPEYAHLMPVRESIYKLDRLEGLAYNVKLQQLEIGATENKEVEAHLLKTYGDTYKHIAKSVLPKIATVDKSAVQQLLNSKWINDENFSDRIWNTKQKLMNYLNTDFKNAIIRGDNYNSVIRQMQTRFASYSNVAIRRLVRTEGTYIANMAMMAPFEEHGQFERYEFVAVRDNRTSDVCNSLNGQTFKLSDKQPGLNFPPMHANCRSTFSVVIPDGFKVENAKDSSFSGEDNNIEYVTATPEIEKDMIRRSDSIYNNKLLIYERNALQEYTATQYGIINRYLRNDLFVEDQDTIQYYDVDNAIKYIDHALDYGVLGHDLKLYRYIEYPEFYNLQHDGTFNSYVSTSVHPTATQDFGTGYKVIINAPKETKGLFMTDNYSDITSEREFLIQRNTKYKVINVYAEHKTVEVELLVN